MMRLRLLPLLLLALLAAPAAAQTKADTLGAVVTLDSLNDAASVPLAGSSGATFRLDAGTLAATLVPEVSLDSGTSWVAAAFADPTTGAVTTSLVLTNPSGAQNLAVVSAGPVTHARVRVSAFTSGSAVARLRAVHGSPVTLGHGADGSTVRPLKVDSGGALQVDLEGVTPSSGRVPVDGSGVTQPVSAASLPLPSGAATAAKQPALGTAGSASADVITIQGIASMTAVKVDGSAVTQPVSGTVTANAGTGTFTVRGAGAVVGESVAVRCVDAAGSAFESCAGAGGSGTQYDQGTATTDTDKLTMAGAVRRDTAAVATGVADGDRLTLSTDSVGRLRTTAADTTQPISAASLPLPTGAATAANQSTAIGHLSTLAGAVSGTEMQVDVVAALPTGSNTIGGVNLAQYTPASGRLPVDGSGVTQPVSGTVTANAGSGTFTVDQADTATADYDTGAGAVTQTMMGLALPGSGGPVAGGTSSNPVRVDPTGTTTQPVSGTVTATQSTATSLKAEVVGPSADDSANTTAKVPTLPARANTSAPTWTDGRQAPLSVQTDGSVRAAITNTPTVTVGTFPDNEPFNVAQINGVAPSMGNGASGTGVQRVTIASDSTGIVQPVPGTTGGLSVSGGRVVSAASTNATNVKSSAGQVYLITASSVNAAARYLHLYNSAGSPTCNASIVATYIIPGATAGAGTNIPIPGGLAFSSGIALCITTAVDGTGSVSANEHVVVVHYK